MSLQINLALAEAAVEYAGQHLRGKSSNRPEDIVHTLQENLRNSTIGRLDPDYVMEVLSNRPDVGRRMSEIHMNRVSAINTAREERHGRGERLNASAIIRDGIGNCFEHAVLACSYLNGRGVRSYMVDTDEDTNHVFVVIGLPPGLDGQTIRTAPNQTPGPPLNTGQSVVCDPWYHEWFSIQADWARKMNRILMTTNKRKSGVLPAQISFLLTDGNRVT